MKAVTYNSSHLRLQIAREFSLEKKEIEAKSPKFHSITNITLKYRFQPIMFKQKLF